MCFMKFGENLETSRSLAASQRELVLNYLVTDSSAAALTFHMVDNGTVLRYTQVQIDAVR